MPNIAVLDDRKSDRDTTTKVVASTLRQLKQEAEGWAVVDDGPPQDAHDVLAWLDQHDAVVLVTDWKLNEGAKGERIANYEADTLIKAIRGKRPTFPIYVITGYPVEAREHLRDVEQVLTRQEFNTSVGSLVPQMIRAGRRRFEEHRDLLRRMDEKARLVASGAATKADRIDLQSLQGYFQADLPEILHLDSILKRMADANERALELRTKVEERLGKKKRKKEK